MCETRATVSRLTKKYYDCCLGDEPTRPTKAIHNRRRRYGDFQTIKEFAPQDATTNPTLILKAVEKDENASLADKAVASCRDSGLSGQALVDAVASELLVLFGIEILNIIPGRVSTEVDARLSYDTEGTIAKARNNSALSI